MALCRKLTKKEGILIQQISKHQKEYGIKNKIIRKKYTTTTHGKIYVDDNIAARIWSALHTNSEKVSKIKSDEIERQHMTKMIRGGSLSESGCDDKVEKRLNSKPSQMVCVYR